MFYLRGLVRLLGGTLGHAGRVAQGENDRLLVKLAHVLEDLSGESLGLGSGACNNRDYSLKGVAISILEACDKLNNVFGLAIFQHA